MFLTNGLNAILVKCNRGYSSYYDDTDKKEQRIKVIVSSIEREGTDKIARCWTSVIEGSGDTKLCTITIYYGRIRK